MYRSSDTEFMAEALREALRAVEHGDVPIGAVVVADGVIVGRGHNEKESRPDATAHAEIIALQQASRALDTWRLLDCILYCTMEPCLMCAGAMVQARLGRLVYAVDDPKAGAAGSMLDVLRMPWLNHRVEVVRGVMATEVEAELRRFFAGLRATGL